MISVLIPIFNEDATKLVLTIYKQLQKINIPYEIICFDDGSKESFKLTNRRLGHLFGVNYVELSENQGRAKIRNKLASVANFPNLLFLDCDGMPTSAKFIKNYLNHSDSVVYGGRIYNKAKPRAKSKKLHWLFGKKREELSSKKRQRSPYLNFLSNNFLIDRKTFLSIKFDETIEEYGYEDVVFSESLKSLNIPIRHIDNPTKHLGIIKNKEFLIKIRQSIKNLKILTSQNKIRNTRLLKAIDFMDKLKMTNIILYLLEKKKSEFENKLLGNNPKLLHLDLLKIYYYLKD